MHRLAVPRGKAYALDCLGYLGIAAATLPVGIVLQQTGVGQHQWAVWGLSAVPPLLAAGVAARAESGPARATWGKRRLRLVVDGSAGGTRDGATTEEAPSPGRALLRNLVKITIPWQVGHTVAIGAAYGGFEDGDPVTIVAGGLSYLIIGVLVGGVVLGQGRAVHDRLAGTRVEPA